MLSSLQLQKEALQHLVRWFIFLLNREVLWYLEIESKDLMEGYGYVPTLSGIN
jgi:hypothetical protein